MTGSSRGSPIWLDSQKHPYLSARCVQWCRFQCSFPAQAWSGGVSAGHQALPPGPPAWQHLLTQCHPGDKSRSQSKQHTQQALCLLFIFLYFL